MMETLPHTRLAILGTLSDLHCEPLPYDLAALRQLIIELAPEILCAEITTGRWEAGDLISAEVEVREALAPVVAFTDTVLVPVAPTEHQFLDFAPRIGWRWSLVRAFERFLRWGQRRAGTPEAVNGHLFGAFCHTLCWSIERLWTKEARSAWEAQNHTIAENILQAVRRDPGRRILVAMRCQRLHRLVPLLRSYGEEMQIVNFQKL
jgi:hypothetical protein